MTRCQFLSGGDVPPLDRRASLGLLPGASLGLLPGASLGLCLGVLALPSRASASAGRVARPPPGRVARPPLGRRARLETQGQRLRVLRHQRQHLIHQRQTLRKLTFLETPAGILQ